ncbi:MAG: hypothetical protein R6U99_07445 [Nioella sp.]
MRNLTPAAVLVLLAACGADQGHAPLPDDPSAPFPLANSTVVGQPAPGAILVETTRPQATKAGVQRAARTWCGGAAQVSPISENVGLIVPLSRTWLVRCR